MSLLKKLSSLIIPKKDPLKFLKDILADIERETKQKVSDRLYTWIYQYDNWIDIIMPIVKDIPHEEQFNSMVVLRLMELQKALLWLQICATYGAYHQLIRELRYLFESMLQAYYIDVNYPKNTMMRKLEILRRQEKNLYGRKLIERLTLSNKDKDFLKKIYGEICKYIHPTYKQLEEILGQRKFDIIVTFGFDNEFFNKCEEFTNNVLDAIFYMVLRIFPTVTLKLKDDKMFIYWLKELKSNLCLNFLKDFKNI